MFPFVVDAISISIIFRKVEMSDLALVFRIQ